MSEEVTGTVEVSTSEPSEPVATPTTIDLSDESLVRLPGAKEPVKYGDHYRGLQRELTKKAQEAAKYRKAQEDLENRYQQAQYQLQRYEAQLRSSQGTGANQDPFAEFEQLPYLSGADTRKLAQLFEQRYGRYSNDIAARDQVLKVLAEELLNMKQQFGSVAAERANTSFDSKINTWVKQLGLPEGAVDLAKEIYLAYEGDDLDEEFPAILKSRWEGLQKLFRASESKKLNEMRRKPFVPGKGGDTTASKPFEIKPNATSAEVADILFPLFSSQDT